MKTYSKARDEDTEMKTYKDLALRAGRRQALYTSQCCNQPNKQESLLYNKQTPQTHKEKKKTKRERRKKAKKASRQVKKKHNTIQKTIIFFFLSVLSITQFI